MCSNLMCRANFDNTGETRKVVVRMLIARCPLGSTELREAMFRVADYESEDGMSSVAALRQVLRETGPALSVVAGVKFSVHAV